MGRRNRRTGGIGFILFSLGLGLGLAEVLAPGALAGPAPETPASEAPASSPSSSASPAKHPISPTGKTVIVEIAGDIDLGLSSFIDRVLQDAAAGDLVIFHVNTFGGRIDAAVAIRDAILHSPAHTVAFVDKRAISAGALISLATDDIVMADGATIGAATPVELKGGEMAPVEAKVVGYFRKEMKATAEAKGRRGDIAEAMVDAAVVIEGLDGDKTTLTLTTTEALKHKIAAFSVDTTDDVLKRLGRPVASSPATLRPAINWAERVARFLSQPAISSLLMTLGMLGILIELWSPGHAVAGTLGVLCLLAFFFGHYVVHLAGLEEIILFFVGVVLIGIEVFFWPGHGALAVVGAAVVLASLVMALLDVKRVPFEISWSLGWVTRALAMVFGSVLATGGLMLLVARFLPRTRLGRALVLSEAITDHAGAAAAQVETAAGRSAWPLGIDGEGSLRGAAGTCATDLRPTGKVEIAGRRFDVVSEGGFLEAGTPVRVVSVDGARIVVRRDDSIPRAQAPSA